MSDMAETRVIERAGRRWHVRPDAAGPLLDAGWPLDQPERLATVKRGRGRTVYRLDVAGCAFFLKAYHGEGLWRRLRALLGWGPARREWEALLAARDAGLCVPQPVAVAPRVPEAILTAAVPDAQRLDEYLFERYFGPAGPGEPPYPGARPPELVALYRRRRDPPAGTIDPKALAHRLADVVARLAEADLFLPDLHPGNLLITGSEGLWRLAVVDLAEAVRPAPPEAVLQHLALLEHFFEPIASVAERLRGLARAGELWRDVPRPPLVKRATAVYRERFYRGRDRRTRKESKYFRRIRAGPWRGWAAADWAQAVEQLLAAGDPTHHPAAQPLKQGRTSSVWRVPLPDGRALIVKRHNRAPGRAGGALRPTRSIAAFRRGHALLARGIAAARPAAAADRRDHGRLAETLLLTEPVEAARPLSDWLRAGPPARERRRAARNLAHLLRRLHESGFSHRDLKAPNILLAPVAGRAPPCATGNSEVGTRNLPAARDQGQGGAPSAFRLPSSAFRVPGSLFGGGDGPRPCLVDLDGLRAGRYVSAARRARDLMRLSVSLEEWGVARRTDRLRFLKAYLGPAGCPAPITTLGRRRGTKQPAKRLRRWWQRIERASARKRDALRRKP